MTPLLTVVEVCDAYGLTPYRVRADVAAGLFPFRRYGARGIRFTEADVATYLERIAVDAGGTHSGQTSGSRRAGRKGSR